jgi:hypothetical protein
MCHRPVRIGRLTDSCDALLLTGCGLELMTGPGKRGRVGGSQAGSRTLLPSPAPASLSALAPCRYTYYAFAAMRVRPNPIPAILLTTGQLLQMAVGVCIHAVCFYLYYVEGNVYKGVQVRQPRQLRAMPPVMSELTARSVSRRGRGLAAVVWMSVWSLDRKYVGGRADVHELLHPFLAFILQEVHS